MNDVRDECFTPFNHDDESITVGIHVLDVLFTEIATVKHKPYIFVAIVFDFIYHVDELRYIRDRTGILFVKERYPVGLVKGDSNIKNRKSLCILGFTELDQIDVSGLTVFIGRVI